jgi:Inositol monophosphatase family
VGPVDGLGDFGRGLPGFTISIGVLRDRMPFAGAVYDPVARWLFTASAGRGAWVNDRPLHVVAASLSRSSLVAIGSPTEAGMPPVVEEWLRRYRLRRVGSTALHLCYVALGALDLVHDHRTSLREVAGAAAVVLEAEGSSRSPTAVRCFRRRLRSWSVRRWRCWPAIPRAMARPWPRSYPLPPRARCSRCQRHVAQHLRRRHPPVTLRTDTARQ